MVAGGGFLSYCNHQPIKFEEDKRFRLSEQFCNYKKWEIKKLKKFPCEISLCPLISFIFWPSEKCYLALAIDSATADLVDAAEAVDSSRLYE